MIRKLGKDIFQKDLKYGTGILLILILLQILFEGILLIYGLDPNTFLDFGLEYIETTVQPPKQYQLTSSQVCMVKPETSSQVSMVNQETSSQASMVNLETLPPAFRQYIETLSQASRQYLETALQAGRQYQEASSQASMANLDNSLPPSGQYQAILLQA